MPSLSSLLPTLMTIAVVSAILVRVVRWQAVRKKLLDVPNARSSHRIPTPRLGGLGFVPAVLAGGWWLCAHDSVVAPVLWGVVLAGAAGIATIGLWDDLRPLPSSLRFGAQTCAALALLFAVQQAAPELLGSAGLPAWMMAIVLVIWIVGLINAFNFMDGIDGIAGTQAVVAGLGWMGLAAGLGCATAGMIAGCALAGAVGFLTLNWPPAKIFMGDVGSTALGFIFSALPLVAAVETKRLELCLVASVLVVWPFVADTASTFLRRLWKRENVFAAHRSHWYQRLVISGLSHAATVAVYASLAIAGVALAAALVAALPWAAVGVVGLPILLFAAVSFWIRQREKNHGTV
jgi:UDP-N-acetylmuramyl pentapeptide phosphotransferase/UDP-N-acetylglucosamine-1-phosphate transferase